MNLWQKTNLPPVGIELTTTGLITIEVFVNNTNLTFPSFCTKLASRCIKKLKLPPEGLELTTLTITGLQV